MMNRRQHSTHPLRMLNTLQCPLDSPSPHWSSWTMSYGTLLTSLPLSTWMASWFSIMIPRTQSMCTSDPSAPIREQTLFVLKAKKCEFHVSYTTFQRDKVNSPHLLFWNTWRFLGSWTFTTGSPRSTVRWSPLSLSSHLQPSLSVGHLKSMP